MCVYLYIYIYIYALRAGVPTVAGCAPHPEPTLGPALCCSCRPPCVPRAQDAQGPPRVCQREPVGQTRIPPFENKRRDSPLPSLSRLVTLISTCRVGKHLKEMRWCDKCARKGMRGGSRPPWAPALPPTGWALLLSLFLQCFTMISSSVSLPLSWQSPHS